MEKVTVAFLRGGGQSDHHSMNKVTRILTGQYIHCELVFDNNIACSILYGQTVHYGSKEFSRDEWVFRSTMMEKTKVRTMREFCRAEAKENRPFNNWGFYRAITPFPRHTDGTCWFCSELCTWAFQLAGVWPKALACTVSPSELLDMMERTFDTYEGGAPKIEKRIRIRGLNFGRKNNNNKRELLTDAVGMGDTSLLKTSWSSVHTNVV